MLVACPSVHHIGGSSVVSLVIVKENAATLVCGAQVLSSHYLQNDLNFVLILFTCQKKDKLLYGADV